MAITAKNFGTTPDGTQVQLYTITNGKGFTAEVTDFGAILVNLFVPDKTGKPLMSCSATTVSKDIWQTAASLVQP